MNEYHKRFLAFSSHVICFSLSLVLFYTFISAYMSDYDIIVQINEYGEAHIEMIILPITIGFCIIGLWFAWRFLKKAMIGGK